MIGYYAQYRAGILADIGILVTYQSLFAQFPVKSLEFPLFDLPVQARQFNGFGAGNGIGHYLAKFVPCGSTGHEYRRLSS